MMGYTSQAVVAVFPDQLTAEDAVDTLKESGFRSTDISVLFADCQEARRFARTRPESEVIGGSLGWLSGIGALAVPGEGAYVAAGPLMGMLGGIGCSSSGISGALLGLGLETTEAARKQQHLKHGNILLSVHCDSPDRAREAKSILQQTGAQDVTIPRPERDVTNYPGGSYGQA